MRHEVHYVRHCIMVLLQGPGSVLHTCGTEFSETLLATVQKELKAVKLWTDQ
jgi:hypothetical protein